jgi:serine protease Do
MRGYRLQNFAYSVICIGLLSFLPSCKTNEVRREITADPKPNATEEAFRQGKISYNNIVDQVQPAVITVHSTRRARAPRQHPFFDIPGFKEFFENRLPEREEVYRQRGLGSGVVVTSDGYILTNHHVVDGASDIMIEFAGGRTMDAKVVGTDRPSDLAVLKADAKDLPHLRPGNSDQVNVGDVVLAVGDPLGIGQTVTMGIISAKGRTTGLSDGSFEDFLQTDAPINQGNSGGALVDTLGQLIGINSQIISPTGGNIGIGFAIPANMARNVLEQIMEDGKVTRGMLGVTVQPVTTDIAESLGLSERRGVIVSQVRPDSAAEQAGIKQGDIILSFNGTSVEDPNRLRNLVSSTRPETEVTVKILRNRKEEELRAELDQLPVQTG